MAEDPHPVSSVKREGSTLPTTPRKRSKAASDTKGSPSKKAKSDSKIRPDAGRKTGTWSKAEDKLL